MSKTTKFSCETIKLFLTGNSGGLKPFSPYTTNTTDKMYYIMKTLN